MLVFVQGIVIFRFGIVQLSGLGGLSGPLDPTGWRGSSSMWERRSGGNGW